MMVPEPVVSGVSIVIPAWNEEDRLARTLERYLPALEARAEPFELVVVADGVSDCTAEVAAKFADRHVRILHYPNRLGKGGAILAGFGQARYDKVGFVDADGSVPVSDVLRVADELASADCAVGSRRVDSSRVIVPQSLSRRLFSRGWNLLVRAILLLPIRDTQCGVKFVRQSAILPIVGRISVTNWAFDVALLYHLKCQGCEVREVPVTWEDFSGSKLQLESAIPKMLVSLLGIRLARIELGRRFARTLGAWFASVTPTE
jgi:dolichol-phosphate mannosyltransferase